MSPSLSTLYTNGLQQHRMCERPCDAYAAGCRTLLELGNSCIWNMLTAISHKPTEITANTIVTASTVNSVSSTLTYSNIGISHMSVGLNSNTSYRSVSTIIDISDRCPLLSIITHKLFLLSEPWIKWRPKMTPTSLVFNADIVYISNKYCSYIVGYIAVYCFNGTAPVTPS